MMTSSKLDINHRDSDQHLQLSDILTGPAPLPISAPKLNCTAISSTTIVSIEHTICISAPQMLSELFSDLPQPNECVFVCVCVCVLYVDNSKVHTSLEPKSVP